MTRPSRDNRRRDYNTPRHRLAIQIVARFPSRWSRYTMTLRLGRSAVGSMLSPTVTTPWTPRLDSASIAFSEGVKIGNEQRAVLIDHYKLIRTPKTGDVKIYDLRSDPQEKSPLAKDHPKAAELLAKLDAWLATNRKLAEAVTVKTIPISPEQQQRLKAVGYSK